VARTKRSRTKAKGTQDVEWYVQEDYKRGRRDPRKRFCVKCRGTTTAAECCSTQTKNLPYTAHIPRKHASSARWEQFYKAFPGLKDT
jgi:hypothetical protein